MLICLLIVGVAGILFFACFWYYFTMRASKAIIHLDNFRLNFRAIQDKVGSNRRICVPVKADAYGHGALTIARAALEAGAYGLAVATVDEGAELRAGGISAPVLLLSQPLFDEIPLILENRLTPFVSEGAYAEALNKAAVTAGVKIDVHLKIDTGMGRMGCTPGEAPGLARLIADYPALQLAGTATHLAAADSATPDDIAYTKQQLSQFEKAVNDIRAAGVNPGITHAANSGGILLHPDSWLDMVRPGIVLYGYNLSTAKITVQPVMELRTTVVSIKEVKQGESVSYDRTWTAAHDTFVGVLSLGYADGLPRLASGKWQVVIGGNRYPLIGRICMDQCMVDLGSHPAVHRWDEVSVFGGTAPSAGALAELIGTIPYEITCGIGKRVPRVCVG